MTAEPVQLELPFVLELSPGILLGLQQAAAGPWEARARCASRDPEDWFPESPEHPLASTLGQCRACPVARSCLAAAILGGYQGVWGGTTEDQRDLIRASLAVGISLDTAKIRIVPPVRDDFTNSDEDDLGVAA